MHTAILSGLPPKTKLSSLPSSYTRLFCTIFANNTLDKSPLSSPVRIINYNINMQACLLLTQLTFVL